MNDFRRKILKVDLPRKHEINNSFGVYDAYKWIRKNKWCSIGLSLTEHLFYTIIRETHKQFVLDLINGRDVVFPYRMGKLEIRKYNPRIKFIDGKLDNRLPIDWDKTLKLWQEDEESYLKRTLVKTEDRTVFCIDYNKAKAVFNNKSFYLFYPNRLLKIVLKNKIKDSGFETFIK